MYREDYRELVRLEWADEIGKNNVLRCLREKGVFYGKV